MSEIQFGDTYQDKIRLDAFIPPLIGRLAKREFKQLIKPVCTATWDFENQLDIYCKCGAQGLADHQEFLNLNFRLYIYHER